MSFRIWHDYGYGIKVDDIHTELFQLQQLIKMAPKYKKELDDYFQDCEIEEPIFDDYMEIENDEGRRGLNTILQKVILECEDIVLSALDDFDSVQYLVFYAGYPWSYSEREKCFTEHDIDEVLRRYVSVLTDEAIDIGYQSSENCG